MKIWHRILFVVLILLLFLTNITRAQNPNATISGIISDPSGAVVPNATVTVTNVGTGVAVSTTSNGDGLYRIPDLIPGIYRINLSAVGFKSLVKDQVELHIQDAVSLNFSLEVGSTTESITVSAGAPLIETQETSLGEVVEGRTVEDTPINGRNPMNLVALVPGVVPQGTTGGVPASNQGAGFSNPAGYANYQIGGGIAGWNAIYLDGAPTNVTGQNWVSLVPTQDSVGEFKVETNAATPEFGRFGGGVISFSTRSGGNQFHGTAYDYLRNTILDANEWFAKERNQPRAVLQQNQFGGSLGGPIRRDKTFFFFAYEGVRLNTQTTGTAFQPTQAFENGDFSGYPGADPANPFIDPKTGLPADYNGQPNHINPTELDPTALAMTQLGFFNTPNDTKPADNAQFINFIGRSGQENHTNQYVGRVDQQISDKQRLFTRFTYWNIIIPSATGEVASPLGQPNGLHTHTDQALVGDTYTFSPSLTADFRASYTRFFYDAALAGGGKANLAALGPNWATIGNELPVKAYPTLFPSGLATWPNGPFMLALQQDSHNDVYSLSGSVTKVAGRHTLTFGGEARRVENYFIGSIEPGGNFLFIGQNPMINFLEGEVSPFVPSLGNLTIASAPSAYNYYQGYYGGDTFQLSRKLTLNYGLRWELPGAWYVRGNRNAVLLPNAPSPLGSFLNPATNTTQSLVGILANVASPQYPSSAQTRMHHLFQPRVGIAATLTPTTVVRAGFGISTPALDGGSSSTTPSNSPLASAVTVDGASLSNPFPGGINLPLRRNLQIMDPATVFPETLEGISLTAQDPHQPYTYVMQWNLNVEHQLGSSASMTLSYAGNRGVHLDTQDINLDQLPDKYDSMGAALLTQVNNPLASLVSSSSQLSAPTLPEGAFLRPYPQFTSFNSAGMARGESSYNGLTVAAQKRFGSGASINLAYTWAHFITNEDSQNGFLEGETQTGFGPQDFTNPAADRSNSADDIPQRLVINYIYDLPFGKGKRFLGSAGPIVDRLVSGWNVSGITTFQSGLPVGLTYAPGTALQGGLFGAGQARPNVMAGCNKTMPGSREARLGQWFNAACFSAPSQYGFGDESRIDSTIRTDGTKNFDFGVTKSTSINERVSLQFRAEFFNLFNRAQFGAPGGGFAGFTLVSGEKVFSNNFGVVQSTSNQPRVGQLSLRMTF